MTLKFSFIFPLVASLVWIYDGTWASPLKRPIITRHNILFDSRHQSAHGQRQPSEKLLRALRGGSVTLDDVRDEFHVNDYEKGARDHCFELQSDSLVLKLDTLLIDPKPLSCPIQVQQLECIHQPISSISIAGTTLTSSGMLSRREKKASI
eukprot:7300313-Ditylum_brightwellii.AAC.1